MQYEGKLYGKVAGKYIELGTTEEYESWNLILQKRIAELEAILDGDPNQTETAETRRAWRHSAVKYADKCDKRIAELEEYINELKDRLGWAREIRFKEDFPEGGADE